MERRYYLTGVASVGTAMVAGCLGGTSVNAKETSEVGWNSFAFEPKYVSVDTGTTVTWANDESYNHALVARSDNWDVDQNVPPGEQVSYTFDQSEVYTAECGEHGARMKVAVGDAQISEEIE